MDTQPTLASLVIALLDLARLGLPADLERLAGRLGIDVERTRKGLAHLDRHGLADARRVRLTLAGLAVAAQLDIERAARGALVVSAPCANDAPLPIASRARAA